MVCCVAAVRCVLFVVWYVWCVVHCLMRDVYYSVCVVVGVCCLLSVVVCCSCVC